MKHSSSSSSSQASIRIQCSGVLAFWSWHGILFRNHVFVSGCQLGVVANSPFAWGPVAIGTGKDPPPPQLSVCPPRAPPMATRLLISPTILVAFLLHGRRWDLGGAWRPPGADSRLSPELLWAILLSERPLFQMLPGLLADFKGSAESICSLCVFPRAYGSVHNTPKSDCTQRMSRGGRISPWNRTPCSSHQRGAHGTPIPSRCMRSSLAYRSPGR